ncbi:MAG: bifunctional metallophosphatase/5'-nucleotidase [Deltaproteobacteria bacterium]|nr:MAG: bifunctional metallophosphatase/5'-nucleotidase [Deltaproteobacteria bacterium]
MKQVTMWTAGLLLALGAFWTTLHFTHNSSSNPSASPTKGKFVLQLLHASDHEGGLNAIEDAPRMSSVIRALKKTYPHTVVASSGDNYITGPFFRASDDPSMKQVLGRVGPGRGDILMLNAMGFQVSALGNHEFDEGTPVVASLLNKDSKNGKTYEGALFPYLSANLDCSTDKALAPFVTPDGQEASKIPRTIARSAIVTVGGHRIGFVGATTPSLPKISNPGKIVVTPNDSSNIKALAAIVQRSVDALRKQGINKIIVLSHQQQMFKEFELAKYLNGVDILIGGGSDTIFSDSTDRLRDGDKSEGPYPTWKTSPDGEPIAILNTDGQYRYVGRFVITFDENGVLLPDSYNPKISGAYPTDAKGVEELGNVKPDPKVKAVADGIKKVLMEKDSAIFGHTTVYLNGRRLSVRRGETNLGNLTAEANLFVARRADPSTDISFKNGGAIRYHIGFVSTHHKGPDGRKVYHGKVQYLPPAANPLTQKKEGQISRLDIENALRFNNPLVLVQVTASQLRGIIEHSVATWTPHSSPGRFPQIAGFAFSFDPKRPIGKRVQSLALYRKNGTIKDIVLKNGKLQGNPARTFRMVTLQYLAQGGDAYPIPDLKRPSTKFVKLVEALKNKPGKARFTQPGREQDALAEYLYAKFPKRSPYSQADQPSHFDKRIQNLSMREDTVLKQRLPH